MSILPNINVGVNFRKESNNLSQDTHTTAEIGYFQPTFCRYLVPKTHVNISAKSLVRLSPLAVPTMGRMSLRHYFSFIDLATLWTPFEALRTGNNYTYSDGTTQTPYKVPYFTLNDALKRASASDQINNLPVLSQLFYATIYKNGAVITTNISTDLTAMINDIANTKLGFFPLFYKQSTSGFRRINSYSSSSIGVTSAGIPKHFEPLPVVVNTNADFSFRCVINNDTYMFLCKFSTLGKRLRKFFIGSGYSFNPFDTRQCSPLKLLGIYKSWFDKFAVQRTINFNNTNCYKVIKFMSEIPPVVREFPDIFSSGQGYSDQYALLFNEFLADLIKLCYVLPPDYFSASDLTANRGAQGTEANGGIDMYSAQYISGGVITNHVGATYQGGPVGSVDGRSLNIIDRMTRFINKRSVLGRKVSELLKLEGESDTHNNAHEQVHHLGSSKVDIQISDVMSLADTSSASLGDFAGRGIGFKDTDKFVYDSPCYGILLCLSAIVPTSGYFQGILKENTDLERFDFFTEDYDAAGFQSIAMDELVSDFQFEDSNGSNPIGTNLGYLGLTPRYQHLRVGRNICNGDISVPSMQPTMLPYNIDRHFITCVPKSGSSADFENVYVPSVGPEVFRNVMADTGYGDYNRIFQYMNDDYDHFIMHVVFDCSILSPMKSVKNSYDTFQDDDNKSLEFKHE